MSASTATEILPGDFTYGPAKESFQEGLIATTLEAGDDLKTVFLATSGFPLGYRCAKSRPALRTILSSLEYHGSGPWTITLVAKNRAWVSAAEVQSAENLLLVSREPRSGVRLEGVLAVLKTGIIIPLALWDESSLQFTLGDLVRHTNLDQP